MIVSPPPPPDIQSNIAATLCEDNEGFTPEIVIGFGPARTYAGIKLSNCVADIGALRWLNTFDGLSYGIYAEESVVMVKNATFRNMHFGKNGGGCGIYSRDGSLAAAGGYLAISNTMSRTIEGLFFEKDNDNAIISANDIGEHEYGLHLFSTTSTGGDAAIIGEQTRLGNTWRPAYNYPQWAAFHSGNLFEVQLSKFWVESMDPGILPVQRFPGGSSWFEVEEGDKNYCEDVANPNAGLSAKETQLALGTGLGASLGVNPATYWDMQRQLILKGRINPLVVGNVVSSNSFFQPSNPASYAKAADVGFDFRALATLSAPFNGDLAALRENQQQALEALMLLNDGRAEPTEIQTTDGARQAVKSIYLAELVATIGAERTIQTNLQQQYQTALTAISAKPFLQNTGNSANYEAGFRLLQQYKIKRLLGTATEADHQQIQGLALEDPHAFGSSVGGAQIYLPLCEQTLLNNHEDKTEKSFSPDLELPVAVPSAAAVFPNPARQQVTFQFGGMATGTVQLLDTNGRVLWQNSFREVLATDISLKNIPPGVYFLHYQTNGQSAHYHKLIVQ